MMIDGLVKLRLKKIICAICFFMPILNALNAATVTEIRELKYLFDVRNVSGTFVMYDVSSDKMSVYNLERAKQQFVPASTFKIVNSIIGLAVGAVKSVDEILPYGNMAQPIKEWERDMGLREAIKISNVPVYQELARRIGLDRMKKGVKALKYGNMEIGNIVDRFWLDGPLKISSIEQAEFLAKLATENLPIKSDIIKSVKEISIQEKIGRSILHGKTGWYTKEKPNIGWYVGWVERGDSVFSFAINIDMICSDDGFKRNQIAKKCLYILGAL